MGGWETIFAVLGKTQKNNQNQTCCEFQGGVAQKMSTAWSGWTISATQQRGTLDCLEGCFVSFHGTAEI